MLMDYYIVYLCIIIEYRNKGWRLSDLYYLIGKHLV